MTNTITASAIANTTTANQARSFEGVSRTTGLRVPLEIIVEEQGFNARMNSLENNRHVEAMAMAFAKGDEPEALEVVPTILEDGRKVFKLVDGHCTFKAMLLANKSLGADFQNAEVKAKDMTTLEQRLRVLTSNNQKKLNILERGKMYADLQIIEGMKQKEIAERLGVSIASVSNALQAHSMPQEIKDLVASGILSDSEALDKYRKEIKSDDYDEMLENASSYATKVRNISAQRVMNGESARVTTNAVARNNTSTAKPSKVVFTREVKDNVTEAMETINTALADIEEGEGANIELTAEQVAVLKKAGLSF